MANRKLFTVVFEYAGGTYISQVSGNSPAAALPIWVSNIRNEELATWGISRGELNAITETDAPVPITGCLGVWCSTGSANRGLVLINIVATDPSS